MPAFMPDPRHRCLAPCAASLLAGLCPTTSVHPGVGCTVRGAGLSLCPHALPNKCWHRGKSPLRARLGTCTSIGAGCQLGSHPPADRGTGLPGRAAVLPGRVCKQAHQQLPHLLAAVAGAPGWNILHAAQHCRLRCLHSMSHGIWLVVPSCCSGLSAALGGLTGAP